LLDAMRDGDTEGMQHFDGGIEQLIRAGTVDLETGLAYATNPSNLRLQLADIAGEPPPEVTKPAPPQGSDREPEMVIE
jgi:twitching motility protein PilT